MLCKRSSIVLTTKLERSEKEQNSLWQRRMHGKVVATNKWKNSAVTGLFDSELYTDADMAAFSSKWTGDVVLLQTNSPLRSFDQNCSTVEDDTRQHQIDNHRNEMVLLDRKDLNQQN